MAILLDGSMVVAAADRSDLNHGAAVAWFARAHEPLLFVALALAELDLLLQRELGPDATLAVLASLTDGVIRLVAPTEPDLVRAAALLSDPALAELVDLVREVAVEEPDRTLAAALLAAVRDQRRAGRRP